MGLKLSDLKESERDLDNLETPEKKGLNLSDLQNISKKIDIYNYISNDLTDVSDAYVIDVETYFLNSKIRMIQLYDIKMKDIHIFLNGNIKNKEKVEYDKNLKKYKFNVVFHIFSDEESMFLCFIDFLKNNPKMILGHNFAHFDIGIIGALTIHYKIKGFHIFEYSVGSSRGQRRVAFSYCVTNDDCYDGWEKKSERYNIIDTLMIAQSLQLSGGASLRQLSKDTRFKKKDVDYRVFENDVLDYKWVLYGIYDVISVPEVLENLNQIWSVALKELKIKFMQSQRVPEHVFMKGAGAIAESYLNNLLNGNISINSKDHLSKYFGGITRAWNNDLIIDDDDKKIRYLDFTSYYPFSCRKQKIFDVLNGDCIRFSDIDFLEVKDKYDDFLYSSVFEIKAKEKIRVVVEGELEKNKNEFLGVGFFRSFDKTKRIADLEHQFIFIIVNRGECIKLTKTELEITKSLIPDIENKFIINKVVDGIIPTSDKISEKYIQLYAERKKLKKEHKERLKKGLKSNDLSVGYKTILNASYGKLAESRGKWFNLTCASAITGYCRATLMKTISYAKQNNLEVLYSDTDSLYVKGLEKDIENVIEFSNSLNEHPQRFRENNLKDEGENIVAFWGVKRKRYLKVINERGKNKVVLKGVNGNRDIGWRDVFFRLSCITDGCVDIDEINKRIQENKFKLSSPLLKKDENNIFYLNKKIKDIKEQLKTIRGKLTRKQERWSDFYDRIYPIINSDESGEYLSDDEDISIHYSSYIKKLCDYLNVDYDIKNPKTFLYLFEKLKADYYDSDSFNSDLFISLLSKVGNVDLSFMVGNINDEVSYLNKELSETYDKLKSSTFDFENSCKKIYQEHKNKSISDLFPVVSNTTISMMIGVHFKKSTTYDNGVYYSHIVSKWEKATQRKAWIGCFFSINRDYTFQEKGADEFKSWGIEYLSYTSKDDFIPIMYSSKYNGLINKEINLDTIRIKTRDGININSFISDDDKRALTFKIMSLNRTTQSNRVLDINGNSYIFRLSIPKNLDIDNVKVLKNKNKDKLRYSNATLFLTGQYRVESALRINKSKMFIDKRDIFSIYRFISDLGSFTQKLVLNMLNKKTITKAGKVFSPVELNSFPRFTFVTQADVYQPVTKEYAKEIHIASFNSVFHTSSINHFWNFKLLKYCELNVYHKKRSAENKLKKFEMEDFEKITFNSEKDEGEYRSEIKFKLKRNYYETLSYVFALSNINQEYFLSVIKQDNYDGFKHVRKYYEFEFPSKISGYFQFNQRKCIVLFNSNRKVNSDILFNNQVYMSEWFAKVMTPLENRGNLTYVTPPQENIREENIVRWLWEDDKIVLKDDIEDVEIERLGFI